MDDLKTLWNEGSFDGDVSVPGDGSAHGQGGFSTPDGQTKALYGSGGEGTWQDMNGGTNHGAAIEGGLYKTGRDASKSGMTLFGQDVSWDFGIGTANAGLFDRTTKGADGLTRTTESMGMGANAGEGSITVGDDSGGIRLGLSEGDGASLRRHTVDIDGDGTQETNGFGIDAGPISFDVKADLLATIPSVSDLIADPTGYEFDTEGYELPDFTEVPTSLDEIPDIPNPFAWMYDGEVGPESAPAPEQSAGPPTGLLDETDMQMMDYGIDPDSIVY